MPLSIVGSKSSQIRQVPKYLGMLTEYEMLFEQKQIHMNEYADEGFFTLFVSQVRYKIYRTKKHTIHYHKCAAQ